MEEKICEFDYLSQEDIDLVTSTIRVPYCLPQIIPERIKMYGIDNDDNVIYTEEAVLCRDLLLQINPQYEHIDKKQVAIKGYLHDSYTKINPNRENILIPYVTVDRAIIVIPEICIDKSTNFIYENKIYSPYVSVKSIGAVYRNVFVSSIIDDEVKFEDLGVVVPCSQYNKFKVVKTYPNSVFHE